MSIRQAKAMARIAHANQTQDVSIKTGSGSRHVKVRPYYEHVEGVARRVDTSLQKEVAYLHDVLEDTHIQPQDLKDLGFSESVVGHVELLTRGQDSEETYRKYIERIARSGNMVAIRVKRADIEDHLDHPQSLKDSLAIRYRAAWGQLQEVIDKER